MFLCLTVCLSVCDRLSNYSGGAILEHLHLQIEGRYILKTIFCSRKTFNEGDLYKLSVLKYKTVAIIFIFFGKKHKKLNFSKSNVFIYLFLVNMK